MIARILDNNIQNYLQPGKAVLIMGPRQTGKTTLTETIAAQIPDTLWLNGDDIDVRDRFDRISSTAMKSMLAGYSLVVIDEAQRIPDIGLKIKLITDTVKSVRVMATGSSSFDLANKVKESLAGRKWEFKMFPLSYAEMVSHHGAIEERRLLNNRLIYGYFPEVVSTPGKEIRILSELIDSALYKDVLSLDGLRKPDKIVKLLQALALQLGSEVSYAELSRTIGLDILTVEKYIDILEKCFIIFRMPSLSRNLRKELVKTRKIYFFDNGIRNSLINNFNQPSVRADIGALWENFIMMERWKHISYNDVFCNRFFWRTHDQQEIDYIEERGGKLYAYEFKWNPNLRSRFPAVFAKTYTESVFETVHPDNFEVFVGVSAPK